MNKTVSIALFISAVLVFTFCLIRFLHAKTSQGAAAVTDSTQSRYSSTFVDVGTNHKIHVPIKVGFTVVNTGEKPLYISKVLPDCHCTVADYSQQPVQQKDSTVIYLKYEASSAGPFQSSATVTTNCPSSPTLLIFRGVVDK